MGTVGDYNGVTARVIPVFCVARRGILCLKLARYIVRLCSKASYVVLETLQGAGPFLSAL